jgi:hypothetical protein
VIPFEGSDPIRVGPLEAVNALVVITNYRERAGLGQQFEQLLFGFVEVLELVDDDVLERAELGCRRVFVQVVEREWHEFADQHGLVPPE